MKDTHYGEVKKSMRKLLANMGLLQIFFALMLVIMVMFVSNYIVHKNSIAEIYDKVSQNNTLAMNSIIQSFDNSFKTVDNLVHSIHGLPYNNLEGEDGRIDMSKVYALYYNVAALASSIDFIEEVIVFYDQIDLAITTKGTISFKELFSKKYKHEIYNADYWRRLSVSKHNFKVFPGEEYSVAYELFKERKKKLIMFVGGNKIRMSNKHVMVLIDYDKWMKLVNQSATIPGSSFIMLDADRNLILSTEADMDLIEILNDVYFQSMQEATLTRKNYEYHFYKSEYNEFIYINKIPYQFMNISSVNKANMTIMVTAIGSAVFLSILLSLYLHNPVTKITRLLGIGQGRGDFKKIYSGIQHIQLENESYQRQMKLVDWEIRRAAFLRILHDSNLSNEHLAVMKEHVSFLFQNKQFVMALLQLHHQDSENTGLYLIEEIEHFIQDGLIREKVNSHVFHVGNLQFVALIGVERASQRNAVLRKIEAFIAHAEKKELSGYSVWSYVSKLYASDIYNCNRAYRDVVDGMIYRNVNDSERVLDLEKMNYTINIYFPFERVEKLSNLILDGNKLEAIQVVKEIMEENVKRNIHRHQLLHIAKAMFYQMQKHTGGQANDHSKMVQFEIDFSQKLHHANHYREIEQALCRVVEQLAAQSKLPSKNKFDPGFISKYIELHYMENLYLDHMAEIADTTPKYFSNYFKRTFGVNFIDYLNKVRLSHARELLKDTSLSIAEIGEKTGYQNSSTFTTTFKKYYGISPSDYRKRGGKPVESSGS